jgi:hypothetical protein
VAAQKKLERGQQVYNKAVAEGNSSSHSTSHSSAHSSVHSSQGKISPRDPDSPEAGRPVSKASPAASNVSKKSDRRGSAQHFNFKDWETKSGSNDLRENTVSVSVDPQQEEGYGNNNNSSNNTNSSADFAAAGLSGVGAAFTGLFANMTSFFSPEKPNIKRDSISGSEEPTIENFYSPYDISENPYPSSNPSMYQRAAQNGVTIEHDNATTFSNTNDTSANGLSVGTMISFISFGYFDSAPAAAPAPANSVPQPKYSYAPPNNNYHLSGTGASPLRRFSTPRQHNSLRTYNQADYGHL